MRKTPSWRVTEAQQKSARYAAYFVLLWFGVILAHVFILPGGNPFTKLKMEKLGREYLQENHPGIYERVNGYNSGDAHLQTDGSWKIYYKERENNGTVAADYTNLVFTFVLSEDGQITEDGYVTEYLSGRSTFDWLSRQYGQYMWKLVKNYDKTETAARLCPVELEVVASGYSGFYPDIYNPDTGLTLDPEKEYDFMDYAADYGRADIGFRAETAVTAEQYSRTVAGLLTLLEETGTPFHRLTVSMYAPEGDIMNYETRLYRQDIAGGITDRLLWRNTEITYRK